MKTFISVFVFGTIFAGCIAAQPVGAGLKVGAPLTDAFRDRNLQTLSPFAIFTADSPHYTIGPYVELRLPFRLAIEADALYRKYEFNNAGIISTASSWEFPVVLKHRLLSGPIRPYFEGGAAFSRLSDIRAAFVNHRSNYGIVAGGGVELNLLLIKIAPEIRYTGWGFRNFDGAAQSQRNQVAFLVGFGF